MVPRTMVDDSTTGSQTQPQHPNDANNDIEANTPIQMANDHHHINGDMNDTTYQEEDADVRFQDIKDNDLDGRTGSKLHQELDHYGGGNIPLVEVSIENLSYAPMVTITKQQPAVVAVEAETGTNHRRRKPRFYNNTATSKTMKQRKVILNNITTKIEPYQLTAWMGPSGSGKTSLMSVVAGLVNASSDLSSNGIIKVNQEIGTIPKRFIGVVWQDDLLLSNLTVEENLYIAARLKTSNTISNDTVQAIVIETMKELNLYHIRNSLVGDPLNLNGGTTQRGISGGERKRVAVGMELVVRPSILLLDEITSGLDSTTAYNLMMTLQQLAHTKGHTIVVVIHQPRTTIYNLLDHLVLLSRGNIIYDGPPNQIRSYLEYHYEPLPPETGIADWMMDIVTSVEKKCELNINTPDQQHELVQHWINYKNKMKTSITVAETGGVNNGTPPPQHYRAQPMRAMSSLQELRTGPKFNTTFYTQLKILLYRVMKQQRGERITRSATLLQVLYIFFTSLFWWRIPDNTARIYERNSLLFFILIAQANSIVITAVTVFQRERVLLARERAKKMYSVSSYFIAKTLSDVTNNVLPPWNKVMVVYWTAGFRSDLVSYLKYTLVFYWIFSTAQSMGLFISITIPNRNISLLFAPPITLFFAILGGFYIPLDNLHPGVQWATYLSFARYGYSALMYVYIRCSQVISRLFVLKHFTFIS